MNRDDIIKMAKKASLERIHDDFLQYIVELERFANLVAEDERETCAKLIEPDAEHRKDASWGYLGGVEGVELLDNAVEKIRNRGEI